MLYCCSSLCKLNHYLYQSTRTNSTGRQCTYEFMFHKIIYSTHSKLILGFGVLLVVGPVQNFMCRAQEETPVWDNIF